MCGVSSSSVVEGVQGVADAADDVRQHVAVAKEDRDIVLDPLGKPEVDVAGRGNEQQRRPPPPRYPLSKEEPDPHPYRHDPHHPGDPEQPATQRRVEFHVFAQELRQAEEHRDGLPTGE